MAEEIRQEIQKSAQEADLVLVGIGTEFSKKNARKEEIMEAYRKLADLLKGKNYFLLTVNTDDLIFESAIDSERIVAPCGSDKTGNVRHIDHQVSADFLRNFAETLEVNM